MIGLDDLLESLEHYCGPNDFSQTFYHSDCTGTEEIIKAVLIDADRLLTLCRDGSQDMEEYQLLERCLSEQTITEGNVRRLREKKKDTFPAIMPKIYFLQNKR